MTIDRIQQVTRETAREIVTILENDKKVDLTETQKAKQARDLTNDNWRVRMVAVERGGLTPEQQASALNDSAWYVRLAAVKLGGLTAEQHAVALADSFERMREHAVMLGGLTPEQHTAALTDIDEGVRTAAVSLGGLTDEQIETALVDDYIYVVVALAGSLHRELKELREQVKFNQLKGN